MCLTGGGGDLSVFYFFVFERGQSGYLSMDVSGVRVRSGYYNAIYANWLASPLPQRQALLRSFFIILLHICNNSEHSLLLHYFVCLLFNKPSKKKKKAKGEPSNIFFNEVGKWLLTLFFNFKCTIVTLDFGFVLYYIFISVLATQSLMNHIVAYLNDEE